MSENNVAAKKITSNKDKRTPDSSESDHGLFLDGGAFELRRRRPFFRDNWQELRLLVPFDVAVRHYLAQVANAAGFAGSAMMKIRVCGNEEFAPETMYR